MTIFINPGTAPRPGTLHNAALTIALFADQLRHTVIVHRDEKGDSEGFWSYRLQLLHSDRTVAVDVPGIDPDITAKGEPWESPRLYVDGSSWLWGLALGIADDHLSGDEA